ncbi:hypothetical protein LguiA_035394 [Lonicera macranthoides]
MADYSSMPDLENACVNVSLDDEETDVLVFQNEAQPTPALQPNQSRTTWSMLGRVLTDKSVNFPVMQQLFASV